MRLLLCVGLASFVVTATPAMADHTTTPVVDAIDGSGPGIFSGEIVPITDRADWYSFFGVAGTLVGIETTAGTFDTFLTLYSTVGVPAAGDLRSTYGFVDNDDDGGAGLLSLINVSLPTTGYYVVAVEVFGSPSDGGTYTLAIRGDVSPATVPEASSLLMLALGAAGVFVTRRRRRAAA